MLKKQYLPEGFYGKLSASDETSVTLGYLDRAMQEGIILEGKACVCDRNFNLQIDFGNGLYGEIPFEECVFEPDGNDTKAIAVISRVGKTVCFKVTEIKTDIFGKPVITLSRREAQLECREYYISLLTSGDVIPAKVTHLEPFGAFVDIGCGVISLLSIDCMSVSRISHPSDRFSIGQCINVAVKSPLDADGRLALTHRELLGTWKENAEMFAPSQTVTGIVRSVESYGIFVELTPNLAGLAEYKEGFEVGDCVSVYIKNILPDKMKVKLVIIDKAEMKPLLNRYDYSSVPAHIDYWKYSPEGCSKVIETIF